VTSLASSARSTWSALVNGSLVWDAAVAPRLHGTRHAPRATRRVACARRGVHAARREAATAARRRRPSSSCRRSEASPSPPRRSPAQERRRGAHLPHVTWYSISCSQSEVLRTTTGQWQRQLNLVAWYDPFCVPATGTGPVPGRGRSAGTLHTRYFFKKPTRYDPFCVPGPGPGRSAGTLHIRSFFKKADDISKKVARSHSRQAKPAQEAKDDSHFRQRRD
jgi:hypothetical protein